MNPAEKARRQALSNGHTQQQSISLSDVLDQQPVAAIRLHNVTKLLFKPASPLEAADHECAFAEVELHLITLGDTDRQVIPMPLEFAENIHQMFGQAIERARRNREPAAPSGQTMEAMPPDDTEAPAE